MIIFDRMHRRIFVDVNEDEELISGHSSQNKLFFSMDINKKNQRYCEGKK